MNSVEYVLEKLLFDDESQYKVGSSVKPDLPKLMLKIDQANNSNCTDIQLLQVRKEGPQDQFKVIHESSHPES